MIRGPKRGKLWIDSRREPPPSAPTSASRYVRAYFRESPRQMRVEMFSYSVTVNVRTSIVVWAALVRPEHAPRARGNGK
jgi:hypothetical protein